MVSLRSKRPAKRAAIVAAAMEIFQSRGYDSTSMDAVAEKAAVSKRTVYNHFAGKEALFQAVSVEMLAGLGRATNYPYDDMESLEDQLTEIGMLESGMLTSPAFLKLSRVMLAECSRSPELAGKIHAELKKYEAGISRWMTAAAAAGRLNAEDPGLAADHFLALIKGMLLWPQLTAHLPVPGEAQRRAMIHSVVRLFLDHYKTAA